MIGAVGNQAMAAEARGAGKRADAVGQQAKSLVAVAREAGPELPRNAQGLAASAVARGIDPASLFAARVADAGAAEDPVSEEVPVTVAEDVQATDAEAVMDAPVASGQAAEFSVTKDIVVSEDPSLALLIDEISDTEESA